MGKAALINLLSFFGMIFEYAVTASSGEYARIVKPLKSKMPLGILNDCVSVILPVLGSITLRVKA